MSTINSNVSTVNFRELARVLRVMPPHIAVLLRGPTGVGKSSVTRQMAEELGVPYIDVRASTMTEGDVGGYPDLDAMKETGIMTFCMPSWFVRACKEPCVLNLDELNRALPGVIQSFFQLVLDRELGNDKAGIPYRLHEETRIVSCINTGMNYDVQQMDPALLRRFAVFDVEPDMEDFGPYALARGIDALTVRFLRETPHMLRIDPGEVDPGVVVPSPASWEHLDQILKNAEMPPTTFVKYEKGQMQQHHEFNLFYNLCCSKIGANATRALVQFIEDSVIQLDIDDMLNFKLGETTEQRVKVASETDMSAIEDVIVRLNEHIKTNNFAMTREQADCIKDFLLSEYVPEELEIRFLHLFLNSTVGVLINAKHMEDNGWAENIALRLRDAYLKGQFDYDPNKFSEEEEESTTPVTGSV